MIEEEESAPNLLICLRLTFTCCFRESFDLFANAGWLADQRACVLPVQLHESDSAPVMDARIKEQSCEEPETALAACTTSSALFLQFSRVVQTDAVCLWKRNRDAVIVL